MPCLGILGTLVLDRIHPPPTADEAPGRESLEDWGGIVYSLEAFEAARAPDWSYLPIAKVGADVYDEAVSRLGTLRGVHGLEGLERVPEPNNRVELRYHRPGERDERLTGGVPGWSWPELVPRVEDCDALYVNFIAGWELDLEAARALRRGFGGPVYCDIHSLLLGVAEDGLRVRRPAPPEWDDWVACFDFFQGNAAEIAAVTGCDAPLDGVRRLVEGGAGAAFCTLGEGGAAWATSDGDSALEPAGAEGGGATDAAALVGEAGTGSGHDAAVTDPTGCGDAWGAACVAGLLAGRSVRESVRRANRFGAATAAHRGTAGLSRALRRVTSAAGSAT